MSKKQNPYHLWLGLPTNLVSPDFFQLLKISPDAADDKQIAASARTRAQQLLDLLKNVPVKSESEKAIRDKLKSRIVTAHKTISDPTKRKQYAAALAAKRTAASSAPVPAPPTPSAAASPPTPVPTPPPSDVVANIPQAIPLAMPIESAAEQGAVASPEGGLFDGISDEDTVRVRPVRARGKRSSIIPIVVTLLIITVIGGLVSLLAKYNNVFDVLAKRNQNVATQTDPNAPAVPDLDAITADPDAADATPEPLQVPKNFQALADAQQQGMKDALKKKKKKGTASTSTKKTTEGGMTDSVAENAGDAGADSEAMLRETNEVSAADTAASASVARVAANLVRSALMRRDIRAAMTANQRVKRLADAEALDAATRSLLKKEHAIDKQMIAHLEVFLSQVQSAADELPGGQDIKVGELVTALVDASPTEVTLRRSGRNEAIPYTDLPGSVAIALGDQGSKKSVPKWNMAKAADLIIQSQYNPSLRETAKPFLKQSISDGYDIECQLISDYSDIAWQRRQLPKKRPADPTVEEVTARLEDFRATHGYKNPKLVKPNVAPELLEKLLFSLSPKPKARLARLSDAIAISARQKDFDALLAATGELYKLSNPVNVADTVVSPINRCMGADMTAAEARHLVHTIIAMARQHSDRQRFNEKAKAKLLSHAQTLVEEFKFSELAPKVKQLAKK